MSGQGQSEEMVLCTKCMVTVDLQICERSEARCAAALGGSPAVGVHVTCDTATEAGAAAPSVSFFSRRFVSDEQMAEVYVPTSKPLKLSRTH
jgi:hypothetical protein